MSTYGIIIYDGSRDLRTGRKLGYNNGIAVGKLAVTDVIRRSLGGQGRKGSIRSSRKLDVTDKMVEFGRPGMHQTSEKSKRVDYS